MNFISEFIQGKGLEPTFPRISERQYKIFSFIHSNFVFVYKAFLEAEEALDEEVELRDRMEPRRDPMADPPGEEGGVA